VSWWPVLWQTQMPSSTRPGQCVPDASLLSEKFLRGYPLPLPSFVGFVVAVVLCRTVSRCLTLLLLQAVWLVFQCTVHGPHETLVSSSVAFYRR